MKDRTHHTTSGQSMCDNGCLTTLVASQPSQVTVPWPLTQLDETYTVHDCQALTLKDSVYQDVP